MEEQGTALEGEKQMRCVIGVVATPGLHLETSVFFLFETPCPLQWALPALLLKPIDQNSVAHACGIA